MGIQGTDIIEEISFGTHHYTLRSISVIYLASPLGLDFLSASCIALGLTSFSSLSCLSLFLIRGGLVFPAPVYWAAMLLRVRKSCW